MGKGGDDRGQDSAFAQVPSRGPMLPPKEVEENLWQAASLHLTGTLNGGNSGTQQPCGNAGEDHAPIKAVLGGHLTTLGAQGKQATC